MSPAESTRYLETAQLEPTVTPNKTVFEPAATVSPSAVVKSGHEISNVPCAGVPSA